MFFDFIQAFFLNRRLFLDPTSSFHWKYNILYWHYDARMPHASPFSAAKHYALPSSESYSSPFFHPITFISNC